MATIQIDNAARKARKTMGPPDVSNLHDEVVDALPMGVLADLPLGACGLGMDRSKSEQ